MRKIPVSKILLVVAVFLIAAQPRPAQNQDKKAAQEIEAMLESAGPKVQAARKAADLDPLLAALNRLEGANPSSAGRLQGIRRYVKIWQNYLSCSAFGNGRGAREALQELSNPEGDLPDLIVRSEILARLNALAHPIEAREGESDQGGGGAAGASSAAAGSRKKKPQGPPQAPKPLRLNPATHEVQFDLSGREQLEELIRALEAALNRPDLAAYRSSAESSKKALESLNRGFRDYQVGMPVNIVALAKDLREPAINNARLDALRAQLILLVLPGFLHLPPDVQPKPGEGPEAFLRRVESDAREHQDFVLAVCVRDTLRLLRDGGKPNNEEMDLAGLFVQARQNEKSGAYNLATTCYEKILASGSDLIPAELIGKRLEEIQAGHPEKFQEGLLFYFFHSKIDHTPSSFYPPGFVPHRTYPGMHPMGKILPNP
jgi:hypothetical protein